MSKENTVQDTTKPMAYDALLGVVAEHYQIAMDKSSEVVEKMARQILIEHPELDEFIMAMGSYFFTYKDSKEHLNPTTQKMNSSYRYEYTDTEPFLKPMNDFIREWDGVLKITGDAMRFTATGDKITDW